MDLTQFDGHTPGPWSTVELMAFAAGFAVEDAECKTIARVMKTHGVVPLSARANAALIAAAPDLLAEVRRLTAEAAALRRERDELKAEVAESDAVRDQLAALLSRTAIALRGPEPELTRWSWHDVPERVEAAIAALGGATQAAAEAMRERDELAAWKEKVKAQLPVAWVRYRSDGGIQGPLLDAQVDPVRRQSWTPLIAAEWANRDAHQAPAAAPDQAEPGRQELTAFERDLLEAMQGAYSLAIGHAATYQHQHQLAAPHPTHAEILSQSRAAIAKASAPTADAPERAEPTDAELVASEWSDGFEQAVQSLPTLADAVALFDAPEQAKPCHCRRCLTERGDLLTLAGTMILCPTCGNKRCPHATDHRHACTGSNEPGQPGSWYGGMPEQAAPDHCEDARGMVCATSGLLGASSGVGRECDCWAGGVCTSPHPCQHKQQAKR